MGTVEVDRVLVAATELHVGLRAFAEARRESDLTGKGFERERDCAEQVRAAVSDLAQSPAVPGVSPSEDRRWLVQIPAGADRFQDVGADSVEVTPGGALIFRDAEGVILLAYAPAAWVTVTEEG